MTGRLLHAVAEISLGCHLLDDNTTINVEYRNRSLELVHPTMGFEPVTVSSLWFDTIDWASLVAPQLLVYPEAVDDVNRLSKALNYLSMYEAGVSEMMTQLNIRQVLLLIGERKVLPERPLQYLNNLTGRSEPAIWSAEAVLRTTWV